LNRRPDGAAEWTRASFREYRFVVLFPGASGATHPRPELIPVSLSA
jgi:hypothetical protein